MYENGVQAKMRSSHITIISTYYCIMGFFCPLASLLRLHFTIATAISKSGVS